jgi:L-rhamnose isomerase/sugar isomerase
MNSFDLADVDSAFKFLDSFQIEIPSWGFANTGTRFGKFAQPGAASTLEEKFADASEVNRLTGVTPTVALHVLWDLPRGEAYVPAVKELECRYGIRSGSINPNLFQDQEYKYGSLCNPSAVVRGQALAHLLNSVEIAKALGSRVVSLWMADGSNYPGTQSMRKRIGWLEEALGIAHEHLGPNQKLLVEYKPFEPAFYHTDIADWGMAGHLAKQAGPKARVLVDTGHHYQGQNIEQIVAWLLHTGMLGGFHFNDRRYADDDLTLGSIDPYQIFQSHNLKGKIEATVQTVMTAQELYLKAALIDRERLSELQRDCDVVGAEELFRGAFWTDVRPIIAAWREHHGLQPDPLAALRASGYVERVSKERGSRPVDASNYA